MAEYTKQQMALIDKHRNWNVDNGIGWWEETYEDFIRVLKDFGIEVVQREVSRLRPDKTVHTYQVHHISFQLAHCQGDYASFAAVHTTLKEILDAGSATSLAETYGPPEAMTGYVKTCYEYYMGLQSALGPSVLLADVQAALGELSFSVCEQDRRCRAEASYEVGDVAALSDDLQMADEDWPDTVSRFEAGEFEGITLVEARARWESAQVVKEFVTAAEEHLRTVQDFVNDLCGDLYAALEAEYEHLTSDDGVWESLEANDMLGELEDVEDTTQATT